MRFRILTIVIVFITGTASVFADEQTLFEQGMTAFKSKDYSRAIQYFNQARDKGYNLFVVNYNLGVSHYKLGQYQEAEKAFMHALPSPKLGQIVQYNLGLVKLKQKQKREALEWFGKAAAGKEDAKVAALASSMLGKYRTGKKRKNFLDGGVIAAYGYDSNVTQATTGTPSQRSDHIRETYAYLNLLFKHVDLKLSYYDQDFSTINSNDFMQLGAGLAFPFKIDKWRITPAIHYAQSELDKIDYQNVSDFRLDSKRFIGKGNYVRFRYRYSNVISKNDAYNYLDGYRHQLRADYYTITDLGRFRFRYEYEVNDRQNTAIRNYSPRRHSLRVQLKNSLSTRFRMKNEVMLRNSVYEAVALSTGLFIREDDRFYYRFHLYAVPFRNFETGIRFTYTDNDSNEVGETFEREVTQAYLSWYF